MSRVPMALRQIVNHSDLTYHQAASALTALKQKGFVRSLGNGVYEAAGVAFMLKMSDAEKVRVLEAQVTEFQRVINEMALRIAEILTKKS